MAQVVAVLRSDAELSISGRIDARAASDVRAALHAAIDTGDGDVLVDVTGVELVDATGLGVLVGAHRRASQAGRRLVLLGVGQRLQRILRLTRLDRVIALEPAPTA